MQLGPEWLCPIVTYGDTNVRGDLYKKKFKKKEMVKVKENLKTVKKK